MITLHLLGSIDLRDQHGEPIDAVLRRPKLLALLAYLAIARPRGFHRRDKLVAMFWPESSQERARHALRQAIYALRRELGEETIVTRGDEEVGVDEGELRADVVEFQMALEEGREEHALELYRGELLEGFFISDAPEFERWVECTRAHLRQWLEKALLTLIDSAKAVHSPGSALQWGKRLVELRPHDEDAVRRLIQLEVASGNRTGAMRTYDEFAVRLAGEFDLEPSAELRAVVEDIRLTKSRGDRGASERIGAPPATYPRSRRVVVFGLFAVLALGVLWSAVRLLPDRSTFGEAVPLPRIAVMPVRHTGPVGGMHFADGLREEIASRLSAIGGLRVVSTSGLLRNRDRDWSLTRLRDELGATHVLQTSARQLPGHEEPSMLLTVRLIRVSDGDGLWTQQFEGDTASVDLLRLPQTIAEQIVRSIDVNLTPSERSRLAKSSDVDPAAYDAYLRGVVSTALLTQVGFARAIEYFKLSIQVDSTFALAWAGLGQAHSLSAHFGRDPADEFPKALHAALTAIKFDPEMGEAYALLGHLKYHFRDWQEAEWALQRALVLSPSYAMGHQVYGAYLLVKGEFDSSLAAMERARDLDPLDPFWETVVAWPLNLLGRHDEAVRRCRDVLADHPSYWLPHYWLSFSYARKGMLHAALVEAERSATLSEGDPFNLGWLGYLRARTGDLDGARRVLDSLTARAQRGYASPFAFVLVLTGLVRHTEALDWLERAVAGWDIAVVHLNEFTELQPLRAHPRFPAVLDALSLPVGDPPDVPKAAVRIAVLPLDNRTGDTAQGYFVDGMTDALIGTLSRLGSLSVISTLSATRVQHNAKPLEAVARELDVTALVRGAVYRHNSRVRISVHLLDPRTAEVRWAGDFEKGIEDIFLLQSEVALAIATEVVAELAPSEIAALSSAEESLDPDAYEFYLLGRAKLWNPEAWGRESSVREALGMYEQAIALDSGFAAAYAAASFAHTNMYWFGYDASAGRARKARVAAGEALRLDPKLAEAHDALGAYFQYVANDARAALGHFERARRERGNSSEVLYLLAGAHRALGNWETAASYFQQSVDLDPLNRVRVGELAGTLGAMREYTQAERLVDRLIALNPDDIANWIYKAYLAVQRNGDVTVARRIMRDAARRFGISALISTSARSTGLQLPLVELLDAGFRRTLDTLSVTSSSADVFQAGEEFYLLKAGYYRRASRPERALAYYDSARVVLENALSELAIEMAGSASMYLSHLHSRLGIAYAGLGRKKKAIAEGEAAVSLLPLSRDAAFGTIPLDALAEIYVMVGEYDDATDLLRQLLSIPSDISVGLLSVDPRFAALRQDARFLDLLAQAG